MAYMLSEHAAQTPDAIALIYHDQVWNFASLYEQVTLTAARLNIIVMGKNLSSMGPQPGDHVAVLMPTRPEYVFLVLALDWLGCVIVPLSTRLTDREVHSQLEIAQCRALICSAQTEERVVALADTVTSIVSVDETTLPGIQSLHDIQVEDKQLKWRQLHADKDEKTWWTAAIIFTSGTTGSSKGVRISFDNFISSAKASEQLLGRESALRWLLCMPLYHVGGLSIIVRCCIYGTTIVLHDGFDVTAVNDALDRGAITMVSLVPTMLHRLVEARGGKLFPETLRCVLLGGAAASPKLVAQCIEQNIPIALTYGLTEACSQVATSTPDEVRAKLGSVGRPLPGTSVRILADNGAELPAGEIGEIVVSGPTVMKGYLGNEEATAAAIRDGWLHTGDLGYLDADGFLWPVQRRSDLIVSGGENVYPAEVEAVLETHPSVKDVCVVGIEDAEWGQRVAALAVLAVSASPSPDAESLIAYCHEKLAGYKCPRLIHFVDALPRTASGKVQRHEAARLVEEWLAGARQAG